MNVKSLIIYIVVGLALFWLYRAEEKLRRGNELWSEAVKIAKCFGDTEIALFRFKRRKDTPGERLWVLIDFCSRYDDIYSLSSHEKSYIVKKIYSGANKKEIELAEEETRKLLSLLPYHIEIFDAPIPYETYQDRVSENIHRRIMGGSP